MLDDARLSSFEAFLLELNQVAADAILPLFRGDHGIENKASAGAYDPVTAADRAAEAAIRKLVAMRYPEHGVVGEEYGEDRPNAEAVWVVDPIDGTRAFVAGLPVWTTLVALRFHGVPILGSIGQPFIGEAFIGSRRGSRLVTKAGDRRLRTRACAGLANATIATTDPEACFDDARRAKWTALRSRARLARTGCDAYAYAMVALGAVDLVVESGLKTWDIEAAIPVIEGAGGVVTDWRGQTVGRSGGDVAIAGDRACLDEALEILG